MKRILLQLSAVITSCILFTSCYNKRYDCECVDTANQVYLETVVANSTKRAADKCKVMEISGKFNRTTVCELK
ncbi:MAG: hypothetical protein JNL72_09515 [Flavipsychrobacter sp.]|nr:hypothetical protein [Flavipsychrobacter sp.]